MSVRMEFVYEGELRCRAVHVPSSSSLETDAPRDNAGRGESFSPTDLVGAALGACMLTTMAIAAKRSGLDIPGARAHVEKEMVADPDRRIAALPARIEMPEGVPLEERERLERAARGCPVARSLDARIEIDVEFSWAGGDPRKETA